MRRSVLRCSSRSASFVPTFPRSTAPSQSGETRCVLERSCSLSRLVWLTLDPEQVDRLRFRPDESPQARRQAKRRWTQATEGNNHPQTSHLHLSRNVSNPSVRSSCDATQQAEKECEDAKEVFEAINGQIVNELPQLLDLRIPYLDPSFEAMVRLQAQFAEQSYQKLSGVQRCVPLFSC